MLLVLFIFRSWSRCSSLPAALLFFFFHKLRFGHVIFTIFPVKIDGIRLISIFSANWVLQAVRFLRVVRKRSRTFCEYAYFANNAWMNSPPCKGGYLRLRQSVVYPYNQLLSLSHWVVLLEQIIESRSVGYCIFGKGGDYHATNDAVKLIEPNNDDVDHSKSVETHGSGFPDFIGAMKNIPVRKESGRDVLVSDSERKRVHQCFR